MLTPSPALPSATNIITKPVLLHFFLLSCLSLLSFHIYKLFPINSSIQIILCFDAKNHFLHESTQICHESTQQNGNLRGLRDLRVLRGSKFQRLERFASEDPTAYPVTFNVSTHPSRNLHPSQVHRCLLRAVLAVPVHWH